MNLLAKFRETALSVLPVTAIVLLLGATVAPPGAIAPGRFLASSLLLVVGLTAFLLGVDLGVEPMGERTGSSLVERRNLALLLGVAFAVGFTVTAAEPDVQVFADQVRGAFSGVGKAGLALSIAVGVALFLVVGLLRTVFDLPVKAVLLGSYALVAVAAVFARPDFIGVAFDSGGATTGPMTVPFVMALGIGVAAVRGRAEGGFGLTGIASAGPVLAVLLFSHAVQPEGISRAESAAVVSCAESAGSAEVVPVGGGPGEAEPPPVGGRAESAGSAEVVPVGGGPGEAEPPPVGGRAESAAGRVPWPVGHALRETTVSILPLFAMFLLFRRFLFRMSARQAVKLAIGFVYAFAGLFVFLLGVGGGFMQAGAALGAALGENAAAGGAGAWALLMGTGLAFGAIVVCAEPAVWVLCEQVENLTGGAIKRRALLVFLSAGTAAAIGLAIWRAVAGFPLGWILVPGYAVALLLMAKSPSLFTAIAFDSGGVASGPLTSTFVLSFSLGAAAGGTGGDGRAAFGVIALVALMPLVALQAMGILYERGRRKALGAAASGPAPTPKGDKRT